MIYYFVRICKKTIKWLRSAVVATGYLSYTRIHLPTTQPNFLDTIYSQDNFPKPTSDLTLFPPQCNSNSLIKIKRVSSR